MTKKRRNSETRSNFHTWLLVGTVAFLGILTWFATRTTDFGAGGETLPTVVITLSPELFQGKTQEAYEVAREIPKILAELPCYCGCADTVGHEHNLHCYVDTHAAG